MWVWNRGKAADAAPPAEKVRHATGLPVALDWYWWHKNGYDTSYPTYWPPREGAATFRRTVKRLESQGICTQAYTNGMVWDMDGKSWRKGGSAEAVVQRDGSVKAVQFNSFTGSRLAWMCGGAIDIFKEKIKRTAKRLSACGLSGLYLDMIGCETGECCHSGRHSHAPGGGNYQTHGFRKMLEEIRKENPGVMLSTEYGSENYMGLFDTAISLCPSMERLGMEPPAEFVPAFTAVYHGRTPIFGNYAMPDSIPPFDPLWPKASKWKKEKKWHLLCPDQFFVELARTLVWGYQPTVANLRNEHLTSPEFKDIRQFIYDTARFYYDNREFLFDGNMLPFGKMETDTVRVEFLSRFVFTREGEEKIITKELPAALHSVWRSPGGKIGLIVANYSRRGQHFKFACDFGSMRHLMPPRSYRLFVLNAKS